MHDAMREARCEIFDSLDGRQTWGAYQHYGNAYFRLFDAAANQETVKSKKRQGRAAKHAAAPGS
jgi:hypothetical protein